MQIPAEKSELILLFFFNIPTAAEKITRHYKKLQENYRHYNNDQHEIKWPYLLS